MKNLKGKSNREEGQSLVLILLVLVIGATVAFAIASRTIQDIRRVGKERQSEIAGDQVISALDSIVGESLWSQIEESGGFIGICDLSSGNLFEHDLTGAEICVLDEAALFGLGLDLSECTEGAEVQIRKEDGVVEQPIEKDGVYEVNLSGDVDGHLSLDFQEGDHLLFKFYYYDEGTSAWVQDVEQAFNYYYEPSDWGTFVSSTSFDVTYTPHAQQYLRIRAIGARAVISLADIPGQQFTIRGACYVSGTYREFVRILPLNSFVPACFDYALFDGTSEIDELSPLP